MIDFHNHVKETYASKGTIFQPRLGFSKVDQMLRGLHATASSSANSVCTITLDAFTRTGDIELAQAAIDSGAALNGFPVLNFDVPTVRSMLNEINDTYALPLQIRHGSAKPSAIFQRMVEVGANATEGGPVSYCLPYSRIPLKDSIADWSKACLTLSRGVENSHVESFGGCMMGQMCDPALLIAINILEGIFLKEHGISTISFPLTQGVSPKQDLAAFHATRYIADQFFAKNSYHLVCYVFMGLFPKTVGGFCRITNDALDVANSVGVERIIVKTPAESKRVPTISENIASLEYAAHVSESSKPGCIEFDDEEYHRIIDTALYLIKETLLLDDDISTAILKAFDTGVLSVPYCLHPDNKRTIKTVVSSKNYYRMFKGDEVENSFGLQKALSTNLRNYDMASPA